MRKLGLTGAIALALGVGCLPAASQGAKPFPDQSGRIIVPFSPGSVTDLLARTISDKLSERWGQPVIAENKPGIPVADFVGVIQIASMSMSQPSSPFRMSSNGWRSRA